MKPQLIPALASGGSYPKTLKEFQPMLLEYRKASRWRSTWQLSSTLFSFLCIWVAMYWIQLYSYWLALILAVPAALFLVRIFVIQHDCGHRSFFRSKRTNDFIGTALSIVTWTPYHCWRREHASHHATSGNLDRRGHSGEIWTMTVKEYREADRKTRFRYRLFRNPVVIFVLGPAFHFIIQQRFSFHLPKTWIAERKSVRWTNLRMALAMLLVCWLVGPGTFFLIHLPIVILAAQIGVWLFYVQHQYEDAFWEASEDWNYVDAAMAGSSYYRLPKVLQWFTANIGLHHVHHLDSQIPNYRLQKCHDENPALHHVTEVSVWKSLSCIFLKLWDEDQQKMVGFRAARQPAVPKVKVDKEPKVDAPRLDSLNVSP